MPSLFNNISVVIQIPTWNILKFSYERHLNKVFCFAKLASKIMDYLKNIQENRGIKVPTHHVIIYYA